MSCLKKTDRRPERSRLALLNAFRELILKRGYEAITINDIAANANVGRSTFYLHFASKDEILKQSISPLLSVLAGLLQNRVSLRNLHLVIEHFSGNRCFAAALFGGPTRSLLSCFLADMIEENLAAKYENSRLGKAILSPHLLAAYVAESQIALLHAWLSQNRSEDTVEDLSQALSVSSKALVSAILGANP